MATVSHNAMQPHPALYGNGNAQLISNQYYVAANQQIFPMYDKSKKTWSQRLKITKSDKSPSPQSELPDYPQSALSRSMKYAEPWLYGTVRGIPAPPLHGQAIFSPMPAEVAVVVCSCPEYLNGTKKEIKKASVCKKCRGSRLPLAPIGGTVRIRPTSAPIIHTPRTSAGTVRMVSSTKSRPTILDLRNDPYDLMRRSRLVSPEPKQPSIDKSLKLRAKSVSPTRGRSRSRHLRPEDIISSGSSSAHKNGTVSIRPHSTLRMKSERWLESMEHDPGGRKSILHCNVNPYDLISSKSQTINEFAPQSDMFLPSPKFEVGSSSLAAKRANVKSNAEQRTALGETSTNKRGDRDSENASLIPRKTQARSKLESKPIEPPSKTEMVKSPKEQIKPKRPPRRKQESSADEDIVENSDNVVKQPNEQDSGQSITITAKPTLKFQFLSPDSNPVTSPSNQKGIKSILKRPSSSTPTSSDTDSKTEANREENASNKSIVIENQDSKSNVGIGHIANPKEKDSPGVEWSAGSSSQFYLPIPQTRKKVQFMVENRIFHHEAEHDATIKGTTSAAVSNGNRDESAAFKRKELQTTSTNNENSTNDLPRMEEHQKDFNLLHSEQDRNCIPVQSSPESSASNRSNMERKILRNPPMILDTTKYSSMNPKENSLIVVSPAQKNSIHSFSPDQNDSEWNMFDGHHQIENPSAPGSDHKQSGNSFHSDASIISTPSPPPNRRFKSLRRTHSARSNNTTTVLLNFNDTMALRIKNIRPDSRDLFAEDSGCQASSSSSTSTSPPSSSLGHFPMITNHTSNSQPPLSPRQRIEDSSESLPESLVSQQMGKPVAATSTDSEDSSKNPTKLPLNNFSTSNDEISLAKNEIQINKMLRNVTAKDATTVLFVDASAEMQPARPPRQGYKKLTWQLEAGTNTSVKCEQQDYLTKDNGTSSNHTSNEGTLLEHKGCTSNRSDLVFNKDNEDLNVSVRNVSLNSTNVQQKLVPLGKLTEKEKLLQAHNEILNGSRLFGVQSEKSVQKTVVLVAPYNKEGPEVHRLRISHEENSPSLTISQKKTSILINGDNCYSTVNVSSDTPLYQSSVVVNNGVSTVSTDGLKTSLNTVTINVSSPSSQEEEFTTNNNKINTLLSLNSSLMRTDSSSSTLSPSSSSSGTISDGDSSSYSGSLKRGSTLITLEPSSSRVSSEKDSLTHEKELVKILRNPVEAVKRNLIPHVCGKSDDIVVSPRTEPISNIRNDLIPINKPLSGSFIGKLLEDPTLHQLAEGLENEIVVKLIENSLKRLKDSRQSLDTSGTKDNESMNKLIDLALQKVKEERLKLESKKRIEAAEEAVRAYQRDQQENGSISSSNSYGSASYDLFDFENNESDCYQSCSSEMTTEDDAQSTRSKFYQMLVDATLSEIEISTSNEDDHHYESIRVNCDPIYEEISEVPPPLPLSPPPIEAESDKKAARSMFEGASKYDILSYLVDAKERGLVREEPYEYNFSNTSEIIVEEEIDTLADLNKNKASAASSRASHLSVTSDSSEDVSLTSSISEKLTQRRPTSEVERNDSGVGSETSKSSRSKYQNPTGASIVSKNSPIHLCEDCDGTVETQISDSGVMFAPLVCRKCSKKRAERKEIIIEIVETEEKYGRDLQIILEEFCKPMLVAGLLTQEQLSAIFLNTEELLENSQTLAEKMRDALDIALEQGDDDLLTVNVGKVLLEATPMLHAFETYCVRQGSASLLLANLEKDKELLRIFLRVSQMENAVLRRMNLNSFLMVPVQRVTKYPLLLARLYKVTPAHLESRPFLKQAQEKIELHLNHMNEEARDVPTKLWRRISSSSPNRRSSSEIDLINIKLRKMAIDVLEWNHDEVRFAMEGKLLYTQPTDSNWKKARTIKLTHINALLVTNGKPTSSYKPEKATADQLSFFKHSGIREASLLMVKEKCGRYTLIREPLYLDRCIVCTEADWDDYFEVHEISSKDTFIFKAEDGTRTKHWYTQLQFHAQGMGAWRKRRNALANIMINGMLTRT